MGGLLDALDTFHYRRSNLIQDSPAAVGALYTWERLQAFGGDLMMTLVAYVDHFLMSSEKGKGEEL